MTKIYGLTDPRTGDVRYIGKSDDPSHRLRSHLADKSRCHRVHWLNSLRELGIRPGIVILEVIADDWQEAERRWIAQYRADGFDLVNDTDGGDGLNNPGDETRQKMRIAHTGRKPSDACRRAVSLALKGKTKSAETRQKMSASQKGNPKRPLSISTRQKLSTANMGRKATNEHREKISVALKGKKKSISHRQAMQEAWKLRRLIPKHNYSSISAARNHSRSAP